MLFGQQEGGSCSVVSSFMTCFRHIPCLCLSAVESRWWLGDTEVSLEQIPSSSASDIPNFKYIQSKLEMISLSIEVHRILWISIEFGSTKEFWLEIRCCHFNIEMQQFRGLPYSNIVLVWNLNLIEKRLKYGQIIETYKSWIW